MFHFYIDVIVLIAAVIVGLVTYTRHENRYVTFLPFFLLVLLAVEIVGQLTSAAGHNNVIIFNLFAIVEFCFFLYFFREVIPGVRIKKRINFALYILPVIFLLNIFFIQGTKKFNTYTYSAGSFLMVGLGITFFYKLFKRENHNLLREPSFWIGIAVIFFFVCALSMVGALNYIALLPLVVRNNIQTILRIVDSLFYLFFIIAFLCRKTTPRSLSRQ